MDPKDIIPAHQPTDGTKLTALINAMTETGWAGPPIVIYSNGQDDQALTGSHRLAAAKHAGLDDVPVIDVDDILSAHGAEWDDLLANWDGEWYEAACRLPDYLPADVVDHYGLDLH